MRPCKYLLLLAICGAPLSAWGQFELPGTDIWLLHVADDRITNAVPLIQREGYDNQPAFSKDGQWLYYSRGELAANGLGYTDIWRIKLDTHNSDTAALTNLNRDTHNFNDQSRDTHYSEPVTRTVTSEFSPLPLPKGPGISMVRVLSDGRQELWSTFPDDERPDARIVSAEPVGYHAWVGDDSLALFVLGDAERNEANRLELWQPSSDSGMRVSSDIGRGLQVSRRGELFFIKNPSQVIRLQLNKTPVSVIRLHENGQDFALGQDDSLWHGSGSKLYRRVPGDAGWRLMLDLSQYGLGGITRLALNPSGNRLAVVVSE